MGPRPSLEVLEKIQIVNSITVRLSLQRSTMPTELPQLSECIFIANYILLKHCIY